MKDVSFVSGLVEWGEGGMGNLLVLLSLICVFVAEFWFLNSLIASGA